MDTKITLVLAMALTISQASVVPAPVAFGPSPVVVGPAPVAVGPAPVVLAKLGEYDPHPQYTYAYDVQDALTGDSKAQYETRDGDVVQGSYSLIEADGTRRVVEYTADPINGFNAVVHREPAVAGVAAVAAPLPVAAPVAPLAAPVAPIHAPFAPVNAPFAPVAAPLAPVAAHPALLPTAIKYPHLLPAHHLAH